MAISESIRGIYAPLEEQYYRTLQEIVGHVLYIGYAKDQAAVTSGAVWLIKRVVQTGTTVDVEYASELFDQVWDDRVTVFSAADFDNTYSIDFNGLDNYLDAGNAHLYDHDDAFSISVWIKPQNTAATRCIWSKFKISGGTKGYYLEHSALGELTFVMADGTNTRTHTFTSTLTDNVWNHVVITFDGGSNINGAIAYIDDSAGDTPSTGTLSATILASQDFIVGQIISQKYFSGRMDEMTVWDKELSSAEVGTLYNSGVPNDPTAHSAAANLQSYYTMGDNDTAGTVSDVVGDDHLTITGGGGGFDEGGAI